MGLVSDRGRGGGRKILKWTYPGGHVLLSPSVPALTMPSPLYLLPCSCCSPLLCNVARRPWLSLLYTLRVLSSVTLLIVALFHPDCAAYCASFR